MGNFDHLSKYEVPADKIMDHEVIETMWPDGTFPTLRLAPATQANKPYWVKFTKSNALIRAARKAGGAGRVADITRPKDRELYLLHIITGWKNMQNGDGKQVAYCKEACEEYLEQLPDWVFDRIRGVAGDPLGFLEDEFDVEETGKNLLSGSSADSDGSETASP